MSVLQRRAQGLPGAPRAGVGRSWHPPDRHQSAVARRLAAEGTRTLPMPTITIVDVDTILCWIDIDPNYTTRTKPAEISRHLRPLWTKQITLTGSGVDA